jgi:ubiquitin-protein ligase E3 C
MKLKTYPGDVSDFGLYFVIDDPITMQEIDLIPNGRSIQVTDQNKISYLYYYAHFKMNVTIKSQLKSFMNGFHRVINPKWLLIFSEEEIELIINGDEKPIDIDDMLNNTTFIGHNCRFGLKNELYEILSSLNMQQKKLFLKFVTSYNNPPLFGFETLHPSIKIGKILNDQLLPIIPIVIVNCLGLPLVLIPYIYLITQVRRS